jgi:HAD superfamily hydrolase (TIGR01549 family)
MALDLARIHGLCFDIDGTLSDSDDRMVARVACRLQPFRRLLFGRVPEDVARRFVMGIETPGNFFMGLPDRFGLDAPLNALSEKINRVQVRSMPDAFWLVPGVREALECLHTVFRMTVVSARDERTCLAFLNQFGLLDFFDAVVSAQTCAHTKPYPDPIRWAAAQMGLSAAECLMVGDTVVDVRAGKAAGAQTAAVLCGFGERPELTRAGAELILPSTALLPTVLLPPTRGGQSIHPGR